MASKKRETIPYGAMSIPSGESRYSILHWGWRGLNRTNTIDSGSITACSGVNIHPPYVDAAAELSVFSSYKDDGALLDLFGFDDFLIVIYVNGGSVKIDRIASGTVHTAVLGADTASLRSVVQFNAASNTENIAEASYVRKLLVFPDKKSLNFAPAQGGFTAADLGSGFPSIKYATVYGSRLFGVDDEKVYASGFNNYANWNLDTADETSEANAWMSMTQSNVKADGYFTGIWTYDNHVVLFKKDFTQLVYNNKNPFRVVDLTSYGADNPRAIAEAGGEYIAFADHDDVLTPDALYCYVDALNRRPGTELFYSDEDKMSIKGTKFFEPHMKPDF
ncbi:MAG: hypothetical protein E7638_06785, partial [Ruminococcaceae bacterium]|nr:hypothetical protein [Oscillospiraceae bacterium]